jgi:hypothetical protein
MVAVRIFIDNMVVYRVFWMVRGAVISFHLYTLFAKVDTRASLRRGQVLLVKGADSSVNLTSPQWQHWLREWCLRLPKLGKLRGERPGLF